MALERLKQFKCGLRDIADTIPFVLRCLHPDHNVHDGHPVPKATASKRPSRSLRQVRVFLRLGVNMGGLSGTRDKDKSLGYRLLYCSEFNRPKFL